MGDPLYGKFSCMGDSSCVWEILLYGRLCCIGDPLVWDILFYRSFLCMENTLLWKILLHGRLFWCMGNALVREFFFKSSTFQLLSACVWYQL